MAIKFSQFVVQTDASTLSHVVGYDGVDNIQITPTNFLNSLLTGTAGQVLFYDTTGVTGDNGFFWDNTNKRLGIGTNTPDEVLHVNGGIKVNGIILGGTSIKVTADKINLLKNLKSEAQEQIDNIIELQKVYENKLETKLKEKEEEIARINSKYADLERRLIEIENKLNN